MTTDKSELIGKRLLVGLTYRDEQGELIRNEQFHGTIAKIDDEGIHIDRADGKGDHVLPPVLTALTPATPGEYTLSETGEVVVDPDYTSTWTLKQSRGHTGPASE